MRTRNRRYRLKKRALLLPLLFLALLLTLTFKQELVAVTGMHTSLSKLPDLQLPLQQRLELQGVRKGAPVFIRIFKEEGILELWMRPDSAALNPASGAAGWEATGPNNRIQQEFKLFAVYPICAMSGTLGPKLEQGDMQAPEGFYAVGLRHFNPNSRFHLSFNIGYPNSYDRAHGRTGDFIMVHGNCVSAGCFAMTDRYIEEIYGLAEAALLSGQPFFRVHIFPFRLEEGNLKRHSASNWLDFWQMLKPGYDYFEKYKIPPDMVVRDKAYVLSEENSF